MFSKTIVYVRRLNVLLSLGPKWKSCMCIVHALKQPSANGKRALRTLTNGSYVRTSVNLSSSNFVIGSSNERSRAALLRYGFACLRRGARARAVAWRGPATEIGPADVAECRGRTPPRCRPGERRSLGPRRPWTTDRA